MANPFKIQCEFLESEERGGVSEFQCETLYLLNYNFKNKTHKKGKLVVEINNKKIEIFLSESDKFELNQSLHTCFVQNDLQIESYKDNGLFYSLFNNIPIHWIKFILEFKDDIFEISNDLSIGLNIQKILPKPHEVFRIFHLIKPHQIKVIIIGQDPYPQRGIADGIAFSSHCRLKPCSDSNFIIPNSLNNIYLELKEFEGIEVDKNNPSLERWVNRGVFLINSAWTVLENDVNSHGNLWKSFIDHLLRFIKNGNEKCICVSFGAKAKKFISIFPEGFKFHCTHPASRTADKGFFKSDIFKSINQKLIEIGDQPIDWS
uniref:Uracil-DNA glycosylase-like domain-containing protein n=1 Tax=viral metagenome TaxID=1070528 RepID=A0A6C0JS41_9ZZZZ